MRKRTIILAALLAATALVAVPFLYAGPRMHRARGDAFGMMPFERLGRARAELGLSDQQVDELKQIARSLREENATYREQLRGGYQSVVKTLLADPNNIAGAQALIDQQTAAEKALKSNVLAAASKALKVLTPDQRAKLGTMIEERQARISQWRRDR